MQKDFKGKRIYKDSVNKRGLLQIDTSKRMTLDAAAALDCGLMV
jgi:hypothetical protein